MLNFIISTETFIFSDLTHWLMTHDSLTHLTHKTSILWQINLIPICGCTAAQTQRAIGFESLWGAKFGFGFICNCNHILFSTQPKIFFSSFKRWLNTCFCWQGRGSSTRLNIWQRPKNCNEICDSGRLVLFLLLKNRIGGKAQGLKEHAHSIIEHKSNLWLTQHWPTKCVC